MDLPRAASSAHFSVPKFTRGDLEEVMKSMRPHEVDDLSLDLPLPFFPFPDQQQVAPRLRSLLDRP